MPLNEALPSLDPETKRKVARRSLRALLKMLFADLYSRRLHAGNLLLRFDGHDFDLVILDAGLVMGPITQRPAELHRFVRGGREATAAATAQLIAARATHRGGGEDDVEAFVDELDHLKDATARASRWKDLRAAAC